MPLSKLWPSCLLLCACGAAPLSPETPDAPAPTPGGSVSPATKTDPFAIDEPLAQEPLPSMQSGEVDPKSLPLPPPPKGLPAAPASCRTYVKHATAPAPTCSDRAGSLAVLDTALALDDVKGRDAALAKLESCEGFPKGMIRALRADFAPRECGDALIAPWLKKAPAKVRADILHTLLGQALAARLARTVGKVPKLQPPYTKDRVKKFLAQQIGPWIAAEALAIEGAAKGGTKLTFYGRGIVATEAGTADLRMVDAVRSLPVPDEIAKDPELKDVYFGSLDIALNPRKTRGRDGALLGMSDFAEVGALSDPRVSRARELLSKLYGGRRIDALDGLALPTTTEPTSGSLEERLAARLPSFYAGLLLEPGVVNRPSVLRALLVRGLPLAHRHALRSATLSSETRALVARARIAFGQLYWRGFDFDEAARAALEGEPTPELRFTLALAIALRGGPANAKEMMHRAPVMALGIGRVAALDTIAEAKPEGTFAGIAAYDAALILQIAPPPEAPASYWNDVAARFRDAASQLQDPAIRAEAERRATEADRIGASIKSGG